jgi:hypothetical protein
MGYNDRSLEELSRKLGPADIPSLISMLNTIDVHVGAQFALASQCEAGIQPVRDETIRNDRISALDAEEIMDLIAGFKECTYETQARARAERIKIDAADRERQARRLQEVQEKAGEEARIQKNALKMLDPEQRKTLTRTEREEGFRRSIKTAGLENPQTPEQKTLVERMYRTMVLDERSNKTKQ